MLYERGARMRQFKTESKKLLDLMINSIYTNREIFLRELVSNASDAIDKLYLKSLTDSSVQVDQANLAINVAFDKDARTITVSDNGIGMTEAELEENLGTIAHSGSEAFKEANAEAQGDAVDIIVNRMTQSGQVVDEASIQKLYTDTQALYHLDASSPTGGKVELGPLPGTAVALLGILAGAWVLILLYVGLRWAKGRRARGK